MSRRASDPVRRGSLLVVVRHHPAYALGLLLGCAVLALALLSGPTLVDAAGTALLDQQRRAAPSSAQASDRGIVRASWFDPQDPGLERRLGRRMDALPDGGPALAVRTPVRYLDSLLDAVPLAVSPTGRTATAVLFEATGAVAALDPVGPGSSGRSEGVWVPDTVARELALAPGDEIGVQLVVGAVPPSPPTPSVVAGVYRTDPVTGAPTGDRAVWSAVADRLPVWPGFVRRTSPQVPLLVTDATTYRTLTRALGERTLVTWDVRPDSDPWRLEDAASLVAGAAALRSDLALAAEVAQTAARDAGRPAPSSPEVLTGLDSMLLTARRGEAATVEGVAAVRIVGIVLAWVVVALGAVALLRRRREERRVLLEAGRPPLELTALALAGCVLPVTVGLTLGTLGTGPLVRALVGADGLPPRRTDVALVALLVLATVLVVAVVDALLLQRSASGDPVRLPRPPWRAAVVTLAVAGGVATRVGSGDFDALTATFPLAALAAAGVLASAGASCALGAVARRRLPRRVVPRLALARLARDPAAATGLLVTTMAFGAIAYGVLFQVSVDRAGEDKVAAEVGARSSVGVVSSRVLDDPGLPETLAPRTTAVWRTPARVGASTGRTLLVVDPATLPRAALWSPRLAGGQGLEEVLARLAPQAGGAVPVLVAGTGRAVPATGRLGHRDDWETTYRVVGRVPAFPGMGRQDALLVAGDRALFAAIGDQAPDVLPASAVDADQSFTTELWSSAPVDELVRGAEGAGIDTRLLATADEAAAEPLLVARGWATDYLGAATALALVLGLLVLIGLHRRDEARRRTEDVVLADLGHRRGVVSRAALVELLVVALGGALLGGAVAVLVARALRTRLDPLPEFPPALAVTGTLQVVVGAAVFVVLALVAAVLRRPGAGRPVNEMLRDE